MAPSILLLQARRPGDAIAAAERASFAAAAGVSPDAVEPWDLLEGPPSRRQVARHDAVFVGGAGEYYVSKGNLPQMDRTGDALAEIAESGPPLFASCFGFQLLIRALGGEIVHDPERVEVGTFELELTEAGRSDPLLGSLPARFLAQMGRKDRAETLPPGIPSLASSQRCRYQAIRIPGRSAWATQFHPELDRETNRDRYVAYLEGYAGVLDDEERRRVEDGFRDSPESTTLLKRFVELTLG